MNKQEFTQREFQIITLIAKNYTNQQIADIINISVHTVKAHNIKIFEKLNATTRTEAVVNAVKQGYIKLV